MTAIVSRLHMILFTCLYFYYLNNCSAPTSDTVFKTYVYVSPPGCFFVLIVFILDICIFKQLYLLQFYTYIFTSVRFIRYC